MIETWLNLFGLSLTGLGALNAARSVIISKEQAKSLSGTYWNGAGSCTMACAIGATFGSSMIVPLWSQQLRQAAMDTPPGPPPTSSKLRAARWCAEIASGQAAQDACFPKTHQRPFVASTGTRIALSTRADSGRFHA